MFLSKSSGVSKRCVLPVKAGCCLWKLQGMFVWWGGGEGRGGQKGGGGARGLVGELLLQGPQLQMAVTRVIPSTSAVPCGVLKGHIYELFYVKFM